MYRRHNAEVRDMSNLQTNFNIKFESKEIKISVNQIVQGLKKSFKGLAFKIYKKDNEYLVKII